MRKVVRLTLFWTQTFTNVEQETPGRHRISCLTYPDLWLFFNSVAEFRPWVASQAVLRGSGFR